MSIKLWPTEFEKKEHISREEKMLLRYVLRNFAEGHFVVGIDPLGMSTDKVHMGLYIAPKKGLITFSIFKESINPRDINKYIRHPYPREILFDLGKWIDIEAEFIYIGLG